MHDSRGRARDRVEIFRRPRRRDTASQLQGGAAFHQQQRGAQFVGQRRHELGDDQDCHVLLQAAEHDALVFGCPRESIAQRTKV